MFAARRVASVASCFHRSSRRTIANMINNKSTETQTLKTRAENYTTSGESSRTSAELPQITHTAQEVMCSAQQECGVDLLVSLLKQENVADICVIRVAPELRYTEHLIIVSGSSSRHLSAVAQFLLRAFKDLRRDGEDFPQLEGRDCDDWKCIDFGCMVLHLMLPDTREKYELEKLWTLRSNDEQLSRIPPETLPLDFIYEVSHTHT